MRKVSVLMVVTLIVSTVAVTADAQRRQGGERGGQRGGQRGGPGGGFGQRGGGQGGFMMGRGGGGGGMLGYLGIEEVQKELEMLDDQVEAVEKLREEMRNQRGGGREGGERPDFRNMSDEERQAFMEEMRKRGEEQAKIANEKINEILLPHQVERLQEIARQQAGVRALMMPDVAAKLGLSDAQKQKLQQVTEESGTAMRDRMREIFQGGDRENMREQFEALRKEMDGKILGVLTQSQKEEFEKMKGKPFEMPQRGFGGGRGGQRGGRGGGEGRPERPQRPDV